MRFHRQMINLPRDRMDPARQAFRHARSADGGRPDPEAYVKLASEYSELQEMVGQDPGACAPRSRSSPTWRRCSPTRRPTARCGRWPRPICRQLEERIEALQQDIQHPAAAEGRRRRAATPSSRSAPAPAATRRRCSPATCSACTSAMPPARAGASRSSRPARARSAATRKSSPRSRARASSPS